MGVERPVTIQLRVSSGHLAFKYGGRIEVIAVLDVQSTDQSGM